MPAMFVKEVLVSQVGNVRRQTAGLKAVRGVGEEPRVDQVAQHFLGLRERTFHLVVDHAVDGKPRCGFCGSTCRRGCGACGRSVCAARFGSFGCCIFRVFRIPCVCPCTLVVPAFLLEDGFFLVDGRVKYRVKVYIGQVQKILVVCAGHGIHCFIGKRHGVQKRLHRRLQKVYERLFDRVFFGAA